jgi:hypothetical protein
MPLLVIRTSYSVAHGFLNYGRDPPGGHDHSEESLRVFKNYLKYTRIRLQFCPVSKV